MKLARTLFASGVCALAAAGTLASSLANADTLTRPPQYVVLAFDGSKSLDMWNETRAFAKSETAAGRPLKFTYFINAAYYLANANKTSYDAPRAGRGKSAIGFGGTTDDVMARYDQTNLAREEGNEIANHTAGHWDGTKWTEIEWKNELDQFYDIVFNLFKFNGTSPTKLFAKGWTFSQRDVIGFRAPQLGRDQGMYDALPQYGIQYDTSATAEPSAWPRKVNTLWWFPLASINIAGTGRKTLSMDYNFYYAQSRAKPMAAKSKDFEEQMYQSYINYFQGNYRGNRAPINIGHHFSQWNGGAYWRAEQRFAQAVCGKPEVKCVTYEELLGVMENMTPAQIAAYQKAAFPKATAAELGVDLKATFASFTTPQTLSNDLDMDQLMVNDPPQAHEE